MKSNIYSNESDLFNPNQALTVVEQGLNTSWKLQPTKRHVVECLFLQNSHRWVGQTLMCPQTALRGDRAGTKLQNCNRESKDCPRDIWFCLSPWHRPEALRVAIYRPSLPFLIMIGHILTQSAEFLSFLRWSLWFCWMTTNIWAFSTQNLLHLTVFSSMLVYLINWQLNSVSSSFDKVLTYLHWWSHRY